MLIVTSCWSFCLFSMLLISRMVSEGVNPIGPIPLLTKLSAAAACSCTAILFLEGHRRHRWRLAIQQEAWQKRIQRGANPHMVSLLTSCLSLNRRSTNRSGKTIKGIFVRHHVHSGGIWSGDYLVAEYALFRASCDVIRGKV